MGFKNSFLIPFLLFLYFLSLNPRVLHAADTLSANQFLSGDQTLISSGENFELGFFKAGKSSNYYIGLWYKKVATNPPTIAWVANRETPVLDNFSSELRMVDGNLVLFNESKLPIWSTNLSSTTSRSSAVVVLRDDGNLVMRDGSNSSLPLWQSFDFPAHTLLTGGKIAYNNRTGTKQLLTSWKSTEDPSPGLFSLELDPKDKQYLIRWNRSEQYWTSGSWNGKLFSLVPEMRFSYNFSYVTTENESYLTYSVENPSTISRFILDVSGQVKQLTWLPETQKWNLFWTQPSQQCEVYAFCGAFGSCNEFLLPFCNCLTGFRPRSDSQWQLSDYSGGCMRRTRLQCGNTSGVGVEKQGFLMRPQVGLPQNSVSFFVWSAADCRLSCLNNCSCTAYAYDDNNVCLIWNGNLLNLEELATFDGSRKVIYIKLAKSDIPSSKNNKGVIIGAVVGSFLVVVLLGLILFVVWRRRTRLLMLRVTRAKDVIEKSREDDNKGIDVPFFDFKNILVATDNFSDSNMLGKGGFGPVYKGKLFDGQEVAVKRLSSHSGQGLEEFKNEVVLIAKLQHRNLVKVLGYCTKGEEKIILYEFMLNKSLDRFIFDQTRGKLLDWPKRYEIILGITRGLLYLHQDSRLRIIHRDLKTSNILLDEEMNPKISDFGLARIVRGRETEANTERVVGTYGYMSPEYAFHGHFSIKSDVFSFGVLMLEIVSGKRNSKFYDYEQALSLSDYAWNLWNEEKPLELVDRTLLETLNLSEALKCILIGLLCVQGDPFDRPTMTDVALMLGGDIAKIPAPKKPAFVAREHIRQTTFHKSSTHSDNRLTVSLQEGR